MSNLSILDEVAQKLKTSSDQIRFRRELAGTSTAKVTEISWGKEKEGILKQNTTKEEWIIYSNLAKKYKLPVPKIIAISKTSEIPWILLEKIPKNIHPKNWKKDNIEAALREVAKINSKFYNNPILDTLENLPNVNEENWKDYANEAVKTNDTSLLRSTLIGVAERLKNIEDQQTKGKKIANG